MSEPMRVLTLHQPWASLVSLGVKSIETRSWSTKYRGPLAIHAGARMAPRMDGPEGLLYGSRYTVDRDSRSEPWYLLDSDWPGSDQGTYQYPIYLPLGAIVATATLVDVVPIVGDLRPMGDEDPGPLLLAEGLSGHMWLNADGTADVEDQRPYGDFTPGRFAWLLEDIVPVDPPVLFKGGQGLTKTWPR